MIRTYIIKATFEENYIPPKSFTGFALRGALGIALKEIFCRKLSKPCFECNNAINCFYAYFFETGSYLKPNAKIAAKSGKYGVTKPYVLTPAKIRDRKLQFKLTIFGPRAIRSEAYIIMALLKAGGKGLGVDLKQNKRRKFKINKITSRNPFTEDRREVFNEETGYIINFAKLKELKTPILNQLEEKAKKIFSLKPSKIIIKLKTPTKVRRNNKTLIKPKISDIIANLARKYSLLSEYHEIGRPLTPHQAKTIINYAKNNFKLVKSNYRELILKKHSLELNIKRNLGNFIKGTYINTIKDSFWNDELLSNLIIKLLLLGEYTGVGAFTTAGCGQMEIYWKIS